MFSVQQPGQSDKDFLIEVSKKAERLARMMDTAGWQEFEAYVRGEAAAALSSLGNAKTGDEAMKAGTAYSVLTRMVNLPREQHDQAVEFLRAK